MRVTLAFAGWIGVVIGVVPAVPVRAERVERRPRPNIVLVLADDLGYGDVGFQGGKDIPTPNLDALARGGVRFTNAYVSCPVCSPTRAGLLTGRYQQRFGHEFNPGPPAVADPEFGLPLGQRTLPEYLGKLGYRTGMVGKWHLGLKPKFHPTQRGFVEFFGFLHGSHEYFDPRGRQGDPISRGTEPVDEKEYLTDAFTREAVAFIARHKDEPFFLYLAYNAVHSPMEAPPKYLDRFPNLEGKRRTYAAMLSALDDGIGAVLKALRDARLDSETILFFLSDNGGPPEVNASRNDPLRGAKGQVYEGGIRVPFVMWWPGRLPQGRTYDRPVICLDVLPTAVAAAGGEADLPTKLDGVNLLPFVTGQRSDAPHDALYWRMGRQWAIRKGDWKLLQPVGGERQLYNLADDIREQNDLAAQQPQRVRELQGLYDAWNATLAAPAWRDGRVQPPATRPGPGAGQRRGGS